MADLIDLKLRIAVHLVRMEPLFPKEYVLTLLARHRSNDDAHIVVTADDLEAVKQAIAALEERPIV